MTFQPIGYRLTYGRGSHRDCIDFYSPTAWPDAVRYIKENTNFLGKNVTLGPLYERI